MDKEEVQKLCCRALLCQGQKQDDGLANETEKE